MSLSNSPHSTMRKLRKFLLRTLAINVGFFAAMAAILLYFGRGDRDPQRYVDAIEDEDTKKKVLAKLKLQAKAAANTSSTSQPSSSSTSSSATLNKHGLPQGQIPAKRWIVLDLGKRPKASEYDLSSGGARWSLSVRLEGVEGGICVGLEDIKAEGMQEFGDCSWHCVTGWSKTSLNFTGLSFPRFLLLVKRKCEAAGIAYDDSWRFLYQRSPEGYEVPVFRQDAEQGFFCVLLDGEMLGMDHGGPRFVFPELFGWKSCKWVTKVTLCKKYRKGFWERIGCHARGRIAQNERWAPQAKGVWTVLSTMNQGFLYLTGPRIGTLVMQKSGFYLGWFVDTFKNVLRLKNDE